MSTATPAADTHAEPVPGPPSSLALFQLTIGAWASQAVGVAARLGIADAFDDGPRACDDIAATLGAHSPTLYRLLRVLADLGLLTESPGNRFALAPLGEPLRSGADRSLRGWAAMMAAPFYRDAWTDLETSIRTGEPAFARVHGSDLFAYLAAHPDDAAVFDAAMRCISTNFLTAIVGAYDFTRYPTVIDVGGGTGALLAAILQASPGSRGLLFDVPDVLASAGTVLAEAGVTDRCDTVAGDFFHAVPDTGDLYLLSNIIHDWDDEHATRILHTCRRAMPKQARLLIIELVLPEDTQPSLAKFADLEMLAVTPNGRQRTTGQYQDLLARAGLQLTAAVPAVPTNPASYIEARHA